MQPWYRRKSVKIVVMLIAIAFILPLSVGIARANALDQLIPSDHTQAIYNQYSVTSYEVLTVPKQGAGWFNVQGKIYNSINHMFDLYINGLFLIQAWVVKAFLFLFNEAYSFHYTNSMLTLVNQVVGNLTGYYPSGVSPAGAGGLWTSILPLFVSIVSIYLLFQLLRLRLLQVLQTILTFIFALTIAIAFFMNIGSVLQGMNTLSAEVGSGIYNSMSHVTGSPAIHSGSKSIGDQVWSQVVVRPWEMLQFDKLHPPNTTTSLDVDMDKVLKTPPESSQRTNVLRSLIPTYPAIAQPRYPEKWILLLVNLLFTFFLLGVLGFFSMSIIYYEIKFLVHAMMMAVSLIPSLFPGREAGLSVTKNQFMKLMNLGLTKVLLSFYLSLSLAIGAPLYQFGYQQSGWFTGSLLEAIAIVVVFKYRHELTNTLKKATGGVIQARHTTLGQKVTNLNQARELGATGLRLFSGNKMSKNAKISKHVPKSFNSKSFEHLSTRNHIDDATSSSLMLRYQQEKEAAEQIAEEKKQPVQYSPFVQRVHDNVASGTSHPFRGLDDEYTSEKERLKQVQSSGGHLRQAVLSQGATPDMSDMELSEVMYSNESSIRKAAKILNKPTKEVQSQWRRAEGLKQARVQRAELELDDFTTLKLYRQYQVEYQKAKFTGQPAQHQSELVRDMNQAFRQSGLKNMEVHEKMKSSAGRRELTPLLQHMPAFQTYQDQVLRSNEDQLTKSKKMAYIQALDAHTGTTVPKDLSPLVHAPGPVHSDTVRQHMAKPSDVHLLYSPSRPVNSEIKLRNWDVMERKESTVSHMHRFSQQQSAGPIIPSMPDPSEISRIERYERPSHSTHLSVPNVVRGTEQYKVKRATLDAHLHHFVQSQNRGPIHRQNIVENMGSPVEHKLYSTHHYTVKELAQPQIVTQTRHIPGEHPLTAYTTTKVTREQANLPLNLKPLTKTHEIKISQEVLQQVKHQRDIQLRQARIKNPKLHQIRKNVEERVNRAISRRHQQ